jgi:hypothetical protein
MVTIAAVSLATAVFASGGNKCRIFSSGLLRSQSKSVKIKIYKNTVVLYECKIWSVILREEHRLRVFANRELKTVSTQKGESNGRLEKTAHRGAS